MTIKQKQWQLFYLGFYGESVEDIDGAWGKNSIAGTCKFQKWRGLEEDGDFGPITSAESETVVRAIQSAVGAMVDGLAGKNTMEATRVFQYNRDLPVTGIADAATRAQIPAFAEDDTPADVVDDNNQKTGTFWDEIKYFTREEFRCKCGGRYCGGFPAEPDELLVRLAEETRVHFGAPMVITSGLRCKQHNANCGGVYNSRHLLGKAVDFGIRGKTSAQILAFVSGLPGVRYAYAIDGTHVHMDVA